MGKNEIEHLKNIQLFSSLTDDELHQIKDKLSLKRYKKHEVILFEEDTTEYMYIILNGKTKVIQTTEDGKEILLAMHHSGEFFGEMSLLDGKTSPATVVAMEDSSVAIISRQEFYSLIRAQKRILDNLLLILCSRLRDSWEKIQLLNLKNASHRIKILFLMLSDKYGEKTAEGVTLNIKLTHQEIAEMTGMTRETVTRMIDKWQKDGEISVLKNRFIHLSSHFITEGIKPIC
ncbi:MAG TPA: Crp/Fnr family transcriptional regulator [Thermodesulfovibrionales bacterium]|jgi:CRP/FNR family transcriptional regulator|nr:Crp/Fnr family transcriptional regulator [Thermodesulfovibrionales bacterium]